MEFLGFQVMQAVGHVPTLAVLVTGLVLAVARRKRLPRRARLLLFSGVALLLLVELMGLAWTVVFPHLIRSDHFDDGGFGRLSTISLAVSAVLYLAYPVGIGLLLGAVFAGRRVTEAPGDPWGGWTPPAHGGDPATGVPAVDPAGSHPPAVDPAAAPWGGTAAPPPAGRPD